MALLLNALPAILSSRSSPPPTCALPSPSTVKSRFGKLSSTTGWPSTQEVRNAFEYSNQHLFQRCGRQAESLRKRPLSTVCATGPNLGAGAEKSVAPLTIRDAKIVAEPPQDKKLSIRVDIDGQATQRAFDTVLKDLAKHAPPIPGFRKAKGGKTSKVPLNVVYQFLGPKLVRKFVIDEIIKATLDDYVQKEGIKVNNQLKTDQSSDELTTAFEAGKAFGFDATLELADEKAQDNEGASEQEAESAQIVEETLQASA